MEMYRDEVWRMHQPKRAARIEVIFLIFAESELASVCKQTKCFIHRQ